MQKLRVHVVPPTVAQDTPTPKYREAIQAVASANTLGLERGGDKFPQALTHQETQTMVDTSQNSTQTLVTLLFTCSFS